MSGKWLRPTSAEDPVKTRILEFSVADGNSKKGEPNGFFWVNVFEPPGKMRTAELSKHPISGSRNHQEV